MKHKLAAAMLMLTAFGNDPSDARTLTVTFANPTLIQAIGPLAKGDNVIVVAANPQAAVGGINHLIRFTPRSSAISLSAAWTVKTSIRTVGFNVDLFNSLNQVVASDTFAGLQGGTAVSTLDFSGLAVNQEYAIRITANQVGAGLYTLALEMP